MLRPARLAMTVIAAAALALAGACGVPSSSAPVVDGSVTGRGGGVGAAPLPLPAGPSGLSSPEELVAAYLKAAAGQIDPGSDAAQAAIKAFMTADEQHRWTPSKKVTLIRPVGTLHPVPDGDHVRVEGTFQVIGVFTPAEGTLEPLPPGTQHVIELSFGVTTSPPDDQTGAIGSGLRLSDAPEGTYMSEYALIQYYQAHSIYFWDSEGEGLIPELRYVPKTVSRIQQETLVVTWVLAGPSDSLAPAAVRVVNTTLLDPQVQVDNNGHIVVDVAAIHNLGDGDQGRLGDQLRWSLIGLSPDSADTDPPVVDIYVERQQQYLADRGTFINANVVSSRQDAVAFAIGKGVARPLNLVQIPVLNSSLNTDVRLAAVSSDEKSAALVRGGSNGQVELWVRRGTDKSHDFVRVMHANTMTRPVWLATPNGTLAIVADGKLYLINKSNHKQSVQLNGIGTIKAMSVAPEGRRIALVTSNGGLYVSAVSWQNRVPSVLPPRQLQVAFSSPTAVAWSKTDQLAVAGQEGGESRLLEVNSDGSEVTRLSEGLGSATVTQVAAYPYDGLDRSKTGPIMFQTSSGARRVQPAEFTVALPWAAKAPPDLGNPVSPFYID